MCCFVFTGKYEFDCMQVKGNVSSSETISGINLTSWTQNGVLKSGRYEYYVWGKDSIYMCKT